MRGHVAYSAGYDEFVKCPDCGQTYQLLDWRCAVHRVMHSGRVPDVPKADQDRIVANASAHGVALRWC